MLLEEQTRGIRAWHRERRAWPELALLRPGTVLRRRYAGAPVDVLVLQTGYRWLGRDYFTLGEIVGCLVPTYWLPRGPGSGGRHVRSQSARRFFYDAFLSAVGDADKG